MYGVFGIMGMYNKRYMHDMLDTSQKIALYLFEASNSSY